MDVRIKIFTVRDVKDWICEGVENGLTNSIISNARALALVQNPYAEDTFPAIAVAYDEQNKPVGYTAVMADMWQDKLIFFGTTGFIDASMRGKGVGTRLYTAMMEACDNRWYASDSAPAALTISKKTGLGIYYYDRYYLNFDHSTSIKSALRAWLVSRINKRVYETLNPATRLEVLRYVDTQTYSFIQQNTKSDLFFRSQEMLNWILQSPFKSCAPLDLSTYSSYDFTTTLPQYTIYAFRIMKADQVIGFAMFRLNMGDLVLLYLYKDEQYAEDVYASLIKHILNQPLRRFRTFDKSLIDYYNHVGATSMNTKSRIQQISLSVPTDISIDPNLIIQGGDGDMFC